MEDPTGLVMLGARFYDPRNGAFISVDPEVDEYDPQRLHPYAYANNNPATFSDPDGLFWGSLKNGLQKAASSVASGVTSAAKAVVNNAGTIASVAGTVAMVAAVLPPPAQVVAAAAGAVAAVAGAIDTAKSCASGAALDCAVGVAGMIPGVRQAKTAARGAGAVKNVAKKAIDSCNSFVPGTKVLLGDRKTYKPIEEIELDDEVWAADPATETEGRRPVTKLITGHGDKHLVQVTVDADGDGTADGQVTATGGHPFWVANQRDFVNARDLKAGQQLLLPDGSRVTVLAVVAWDALATVYNLTVDGLHTYFVLAGPAPLLVHNTGGEACPIKKAKEAFENAENLDDAADAARDIPGTEYAAEYISRSGNVYRSYNGHGLSVPPFLQRKLDRIHFRSRPKHHGGCAEVGCLIKAYRKEGHKGTRGGTMRTLKVFRPQSSRKLQHRTPASPCGLCNILLRWRKISWFL